MNPYRRAIRFFDGSHPMAFSRGLDWDDLRERIAEFVGCEPEQVGFDEGDEAAGDECVEYITVRGERVATVN